MGDRRMAQIITEDGSLYVYTHSGGYEMPNKAAAAINAAKRRLNDSAYAVRIIVDQLTVEARDRETGCGLMLKPNAEDAYNFDSPSVIIDLTNKSLTVINQESSSMQTFAEIVN